MPPTPTWPQTVVSTTLLLVLSAALAPWTLAVTVLASVRARLLLQRAGPRKTPGGKERIALVNGGRMQKALTVARALADQGYTVIAVEEAGWGTLCPLRFSSAVSRFYSISKADPSKGEQGTRRYIEDLVSIASQEKVSLFVPCSGAGTTIEDAIAAERMRKELGIDAVIQDPDLALHLHEKDKFIDMVQGMGLDVPESHVVTSVEQLLQLIRQPNRPRMIIKCTNVLDDVARSDMTTYPLLHAGTDKPDWNATERRLRSLNIPITDATPYLVQEFIGGEGVSEWCTHATVVDGKVRAFVCCPSNDMLMTYHNATQSEIGERALRWTHDFLAALKSSEKWKHARLDGEFSMDFMYQPTAGAGKKEGTGRLVAIECNPRVHTAIVLCAERRELGSAFVRDASGAPKLAIIEPLANEPAATWIGHDLPARFLPQLVPSWITRAVQPYWGPPSPSIVRAGKDPSGYDLSAGSPLLSLRDPVWQSSDPWPFFAMYHLHWPYLLLHQLIVRRRKWSRINVSTSRIFEC